jgi:predicted MPP superfamily phosphohydrolase
LFRDFIRAHIFERFPLVVGIALGFSQCVLVAWGFAIAGGPDSIPFGWLFGSALLLALANGLLMPRVGMAQPQGRIGAWLDQGYVASGFGAIVLAAGICAVTLAFAIAVPLLAFAGLPAGAGLACYRATSIAAVVGLGGALVWGFRYGAQNLEVTLVEIPIPGLCERLRGLRVAHLSDLHIGNGTEDDRLASIIERTNALAADLIVITGDLFDHDPRHLAAGASQLAGLRAHLGVFAVLGNHDLMTGKEQVADALARHAPRLRLLRDECVRLPVDAPLYLAGVEDPGRDWTEHGHGLATIEKLAAAAPSDGPMLLLVHRPDAFAQAAALGFRLVLSGHFHGGQLALPIGAGRWNAARFLTPYHRGLYRLGEATLYVSRGLGFAGPRLRFGSRPEIAVIELV